MTDPVNHPPHYKGNGLEAIDVIEKFDLGFRLGNAIKYILRAGKKGEALEDLKKARWYLDREITRLNGEPVVLRFDRALTRKELKTLRSAHFTIREASQGSVRVARKWPWQREFWRW